MLESNKGMKFSVALVSRTAIDVAIYSVVIGAASSLTPRLAPKHIAALVLFAFSLSLVSFRLFLPLMDECVRPDTKKRGCFSCCDTVTESALALFTLAGDAASLGISFALCYWRFDSAKTVRAISWAAGLLVATLSVKGVYEMGRSLFDFRTAAGDRYRIASVERKKSLIGCGCKRIGGFEESCESTAASQKCDAVHPTLAKLLLSQSSCHVGVFIMFVLGVLGAKVLVDTLRIQIIERSGALLRGTSE